MKVALVDSPRLTYWRDAGHRLREVAHRFGPECEVVLISAEAEGALPVLAGYGREADVGPLIDAAHVLSAVKLLQPDLCVVPLRGGLAHGILMARACGELPAGLRVALIAEEPSRSLALRSDLTSAWLQPLVRDAMERFCLEHADGLLTSGESELDDIEALTLAKLATAQAGPDLAPGRGLLLRVEAAPRELCFIGAFTRAANVVTFIEAAERLAGMSPRRFDKVSFAGPMPDVALAPGREWLGRRASNWRFPFRVIETDSLDDAITYAFDAKALAYAPDFPTASRARVEAKGFVCTALKREIERTSVALEDAIVRMLAGAPREAPQDGETTELGASLGARLVATAPSKAPVPFGLSVCIMHKDRPKLLNQAIASVRRQVGAGDRERIELIVYDNGSTAAESLEMLSALDKDTSIKLVRGGALVPNPTAMNAMAACATREFIAFLDDDNMLAEGGLAALLRACGAGAFDVIVSNLLVIDADHMETGPVAKLVFIGPARTAGLFFNGFGDTSMVFRRGAFESIGGFIDTKGPMPGADWLLLARAQAADLRIGVLQEPAFLYRRDVGRADRSWQKYDQHGVRGIILDHFGAAYDPALLAKLSQALALDYL